jgi:hypothetical protein
MKKLFFLSILIIASAAMTSCTADPIPSNLAAVSADDTGGQHGIPTPPPPGSGTGG